MAVTRWPDPRSDRYRRIGVPYSIYGGPTGIPELRPEAGTHSLPESYFVMFEFLRWVRQFQVLGAILAAPRVPPQPPDRSYPAHSFAVTPLARG